MPSPRQAAAELLHDDRVDRAGINALAAIHAGVADLGLATLHGNGFDRAGGNASFAGGAFVLVNNSGHESILFMVMEEKNHRVSTRKYKQRPRKDNRAVVCCLLGNRLVIRGKLDARTVD